jgi:ABC-type phosphate transport system substrate-binding protein
MKTLRTIFAILSVSFVFSTLKAEGPETVYLHAPKFLTPLVEKWAEEYTRLNAQTKIVVLNGADDSKADAKVKAGWANEPVNDGNTKTIYTGRYALVPVANQNNPYLKQLNRDGVDKKLLKDLYFQEDVLAEEKSKNQVKYKAVTVYSRGNQAASAEVFSNFFGQNATQLRGKKINGDEQFLVNALRKDTLGVSFNALNYLYDVETRNIKEGLAPLPVELQLGKRETDVLDAGDNLDQIIYSLETGSSDLIPVERFGVEFLNNSSKSKAIVDFLSWTLNEGQNYSAYYGFLTLDQATLSAQSKSLSVELLTSK